MTQEGKWGDDLDKYDEICGKMRTRGKSHLQIAIEWQLSNLTYKPHRTWLVRYHEDFDLLYDPAVRVHTMSTQSADVERTCKVHKIRCTK